MFPFVTRVGRSWTDVQRLGFARTDLVAAGILAALSAALLVASQHPLLAVLLGLLGPLALVPRRRTPVASVLWVLAFSAVIAVTDRGAQESVLGIAAALCFYTLPSRVVARKIVDVALLAAALGTVALTSQGDMTNLVVPWLLFVLLPYLAGRTVVARSALTRELEANRERTRRDQEVRARAAATEERTRIAREIHDVLAHSLSVMVIQTAAAREVAGDDPAVARTALKVVQLSGREALLELRHLIGVLRRGDVELVGSTEPGLNQLDQLLHRAHISGLPVEFTVIGQPRDLPGALDLVAFRVVQEALTNSIKHAGPARASVTVTFTADALELEVCDDGRSEAPDAALVGAGQGLAGMRERLALIGGELFVGAQLGGGFRVHARLPTESVPVA